MSFLLSGSPIHVQPNSQSIYKPKINHSFINIIFILAGSVLIVPLSKEGIIHSSICIISPAFVTMIAVLGGIFTMIYTLKIYWSLSFLPNTTSILTPTVSLLNENALNKETPHKNQLSFISPRLTISSIFIDQSLEYFLSISRSLIYYSIDFSSLLSMDCILDFSSVFFVFVIPIILSFIRFFLLYFDGWHCYNRLFMIFICSRSSTFFVLPFQYFPLLHPCFFFKGPIHSIEVYTGLNPIYYYPPLLIAIFFFFLFLLSMFLW